MHNSFSVTCHYFVSVCKLLLGVANCRMQFCGDFSSRFVFRQQLKQRARERDETEQQSSTYHCQSGQSVLTFSQFCSRLLQHWLTATSRSQTQLYAYAQTRETFNHKFLNIFKTQTDNVKKFNSVVYWKTTGRNIAVKMRIAGSKPFP